MSIPSVGDGPPADPLGAFVRENHAAVPGALTGPLQGFSFAAKDVFDIAGRRTGFGNPTWLATHPPAATTALAARRLLGAGATLVGCTVTDELTYSLTGENVHYGTPRNPRCPGRVPGGSSSGSVAAVAGGLVDFALGTDCAGSVRLPASYCGVYGFRPTHGRVSLDGVVPFAASFDTIGWFAREGTTLERVGRVLLDGPGSHTPPRRLLVSADAFALVEPRDAVALEPSLAAVAASLGLRPQKVMVNPEGLDRWMEIFRTIQAAEIWATHRDWITAAEPQFGPGIRDRVASASTVTAQEAATARADRGGVIARLDSLLGDGDVLCLPTSPRIAPLCNSETDTVEVTFRYQAICLLCIASLGGLPQVSLPLATLDSCPLGISLIARRAADEVLLAIAGRT